MKSSLFYGLMTLVALAAVAFGLMIILVGLNEGLGEGRRLDPSSLAWPYQCAGLGTLGAVLGFTLGLGGDDNFAASTRQLLGKSLIYNAVGAGVAFVGGAPIAFYSGETAAFAWVTVSLLTVSYFAGRSARRAS